MSNDLTKMTLFILVGGEDGGVGKSTFCSLLAQYLFEKNLKFTLVDANRLKKDVKDKYKKEQYQKQISFKDIIFSESKLKVTEANLIYDLVSEENQNILVNLPAEIHEILLNWFDKNELLEAAKEDFVQICYFHVSNGQKENLAHFKKILKEFGDKAKIFLVKNEFFCTDWRKFEAAEKKLIELGGQSIILPELQEKYQNLIKDKDLSWGEARNHKDPHRGYRRVAKINVKKFVKLVFLQLDKLNLIPRVETPPPKEQKLSAMSETLSTATTPTETDENSIESVLNSSQLPENSDSGGKNGYLLKKANA